jgi:hypothetical protein
MYEDLEKDYYMTLGMLIGLLTYEYWHVWYISFAIFVAFVFMGWKYLAICPFTTGMPDYDELNE